MCASSARYVCPGRSEPSIQGKKQTEEHARECSQRHTQKHSPKHVQKPVRTRGAAGCAVSHGHPKSPLRCRGAHGGRQPEQAHAHDGVAEAPMRRGGGRAGDRREPGPPRSKKKSLFFLAHRHGSCPRRVTCRLFTTSFDSFQSSKSSMAKTMGRALVLCALLALSLPRAGDPLSFHRISGVRVRVVSTIPRARRIDMLRRGRMTRRSLRRGGRRSARRRGAAQGATQLKGANSQI